MDLTKDGKEIFFIWAPCHVGIRGNSATDAAAKDALVGSIWVELIPFSDLKDKSKVRGDFWNHVTICLLRHSGESLQNGQLELWRQNWYWYSRIILSLSGRILKEYWNIVSASMWYSMGFAKLHSLKCSLHKLACFACSKIVSSFVLYKFNPLSPHCGSFARSSCIVIPGVVCKLLQFAATL